MKKIEFFGAPEPTKGEDRIRLNTLDHLVNLDPQDPMFSDPVFRAKLILAQRQAKNRLQKIGGNKAITNIQ